MKRFKEERQYSDLVRKLMVIRTFQQYNLLFTQEMKKENTDYNLLFEKNEEMGKLLKKVLVKEGG